jgi:hypothetical protein
MTKLSLLAKIKKVIQSFIYILFTAAKIEHVQRWHQQCGLLVYMVIFSYTVTARRYMGGKYRQLFLMSGEVIGLARCLVVDEHLRGASGYIPMSVMLVLWSELYYINHFGLQALIPVVVLHNHKHVLERND